MTRDPATKPVIGDVWTMESTFSEPNQPALRVRVADIRGPRLM